MINLAVFVIFIVSLSFSIYLLIRSKNLFVYHYLRVVYILHFCVGALWTISATLALIGETYYRAGWPAIFMASMILSAEVITFTHGNIKEVLKKVLPETLSCALPLFLILAISQVYLTPGTAISLIVCGVITALISELIYTTTKIYSIMKGGKLFYFWKRLLILSIYYMLYGLIYSGSGVLVMTKIIDYNIGNLLVSIVYLVKTILMYFIVDYYHKKIKPIIQRLTM